LHRELRGAQGHVHGRPALTLDHPLLADGLAAIRRQFQVPGLFPPAVLAAADEAARRPLGDDRVDRRSLELVTLDPAGSTDLDQAMAIESDGDDLVLSYAIADVGFFVERGGEIEAEAWRRGTTIYAPDGRAPLYPPVLSEGAASLLPDGDRPAVMLRVIVAPDGSSRLADVEAAIVRSRRKLAYETATAGDLPALLPELARRVGVADEERGAIHVEVPEPEVVVDPAAPGGVALAVRPRLESEETNASVSLTANLAVAQRLLDLHTGVFRVLAEPDRHELASLRRAARTLGIDWPADVPFHRFVPTVAPSDAARVAFLIQARRAGGGATYGPFDSEHPPWHAVMAAAYAHATAPLRRLADRYVLDAVLGRRGPPVDWAALSEVMETAETRAAQVERAAVDLVEAITLGARVGEVFSATVLDADGDGARIQLVDPPVRARLKGSDHQPGAVVSVRLTEADPAARRVTFIPA
jgi:exoribonuclease R